MGAGGLGTRKTRLCLIRLGGDDGDAVHAPIDYLAVAAREGSIRVDHFSSSGVIGQLGVGQPNVRMAPLVAKSARVGLN
jgi:hypothetical protein